MAGSLILDSRGVPLSPSPAPTSRVSNLDSVTSAIMAAGNGHLGVQTGVMERLFGPQLAYAAYLSSGMLQKVIDIPASDRIREWREWQADKTVIEKLEAEEKRLGLVAKIKQAEILRGLGGGALILVVKERANTAAQDEINVDAIRAGDLVAVNVVSRWQLDLVEIEADITSPNYGLPAFFRMAGNASNVLVHPSRVVPFRCDPLPAGYAASDASDAFWGQSRLMRVVKEVQRSDHASEWFAALIKKAKLLRIAIPGLTDFTATDAGQAKLNKRMAAIALGESILSATVTDAGDGKDGAGEKITDFQVTWAGIPAMMDSFDQRVATVSDIPFTRLTGRSPAGMNSTGQHDADNHNQSIAAGQELETRPCLERVDPLLMRSAGADPAKIWWKWRPLSKPTAKEQADTFKTWTDAVTAIEGINTQPHEALAEAVQATISENGWISGWDGALAKFGPEERFGLDPAAEPDDPSSIQAEGGDPELAGTGASLEAQPRRRAANDAWMLEDWAAKPLYVRRDVLNRADIVAWAKSQGFTDIVPDLHVTITYSETPVDWMTMGESWRGKLEIEAGGPRLVEALGPDGKYKALLFTAYELVSRNQEMRDKGASFSWAEYQPHISIQIGGDVDLATVKPYTGKIVLGPEIFEAIREKTE